MEVKETNVKMMFLADPSKNGEAGRKDLQKMEGGIYCKISKRIFELDGV